MVKNLLASVGDARDLSSIPKSGRSPGVGNGNPLQYSCLENSMDRGAWQAMAMEFQSQTGLSDFTHFTHSVYIHIYYIFYVVMIKLKSQGWE